MFRPFIGSVLLASVSAGLALGAPASAQTMEKASHEVRYGDLDLASEAGVAKLHQRIKSAARAACGQADIRDISGSQAAAACRETAMADAAPKIELAIANARSGQDFAANAAFEVGKPVSR